jgi:hypothetical protein
MFLFLPATISAAQPVVPAETAIPVIFPHSVDAAHAKPGDRVEAKTLQVVLLGTGQSFPKGSLVIGHVTDARPFVYDRTPYAVQQPSRLAIQFDSIRAGTVDVPLHVAVRALASSFAANDATAAPSSEDPFGTTTQVGGDQISAPGGEVMSSDDAVVGYSRKQGVFARLLPSSAGQSCAGTNTEQSVAIFSASACGLYGFNRLEMPDNGATDGTFRLECRRYTVSIYRNSAALLQVVDAR